MLTPRRAAPESAMQTLRTETVAGVRHVVLCRPEAYNTITPTLRDELAAAIDAADADRSVRVILLRAEGPAFCAGYGLDWSTRAQAQERGGPAPVQSRESEGARPWSPAARSEAQPSGARSWDSVADLRM